MAGFIPQSITICDSTLIDVQGNYHNHSSVGEYGIQKLFDASCPSALHDSRERYPPPRCLKGTRVTTLDEIHQWIDANDSLILWLSGPAGSGKSAIAQTVAETCEKSGILACTFFFFRGVQGRDASNHLVPTISSQLVSRFPEKRVELGQFIEKNPFILHKPMNVQFHDLVLPFFVTSSSTPNPTSDSPTPFVIIIDGLDECAGENDQQEIMGCIDGLVDACTTRIRVIIISRPEPHIVKSFNRLFSPAWCKPLDQPDNENYIEETHQDICTYLRHEFDRIYQDHNLHEENYWPGNDCLRQLARASSGGIFIYASTVVKYVGDRDFYPVERLSEILDKRSSSGSSPFADLDAIYKHILGIHKNWKLLRRVLTGVLCTDSVNNGVMIHGLSYFTGADLAEFLQVEKGKITAALRCMHSIINPETLNFYHTSFRDFIHNEERSGQYYIDKKEGHVSTTHLILEHITRGLTKSKAYKYSVRYLEEHLVKSGHWDENPDILEAMEIMVCSKGAQRVYLEKYAPKVNFWRWFEIRGVMPTSSQPDPLKLRDRLFMLWWKHCRYTIYPIYEHCSYVEALGLEAMELLRDELQYGFKVLIPIGSGYNDGQKTLLVDEVTKPEFLMPPLKDLIAQRIQENHNSDDHLIRRGHAWILFSWLVGSFKTERSHGSYLTDYSYRNRYWAAHLSQVPLGHKRLLYALECRSPSDFVGRFTSNELESLQEWLKASRLRIQEYSLLEKDEWWEKMYGSEDYGEYLKKSYYLEERKWNRNEDFWNRWCGPEMTK